MTKTWAIQESAGSGQHHILRLNMQPTIEVNTSTNGPKPVLIITGNYKDLVQHEQCRHELITLSSQGATIFHLPDKNLTLNKQYLAELDAIIDGAPIYHFPTEDFDNAWLFGLSSAKKLITPGHLRFIATGNPTTMMAIVYPK